MRILLLCILGFVVASGCNGNHKSENAAKQPFPKELAGSWKVVAGRNAVEFDKMGNLVSYTSAAGLKISVAEGGLSQKGQAPGSMLYMILGETPVEYDPQSRTLKVTIHYDDNRLEVPGHSFSGQMTEVFEGQITHGWQEWLATVTTTGTVENLPQMNDTTKVLYRFRKVE